MTRPQDVIKFWFTELTPKEWFVASDVLDQRILERFGSIHASASKGELFSWRTSADGRLAEILVLDQFSRNIHRDTPQAFAQDSMALALAQEMVGRKLDLEIPLSQKAFVDMPYMHSESSFIHEESVKLFSIPGLEYNLKFELQHKDIIDRFGRYPSRNKILGRQSLPEEVEFLKTHPGF